MKRILLLDLGNVVFHVRFEPFEAWLRGQLTRPNPGIFDDFGPIYTAYERGEFNTGEFLRRLRSELGVEFSDDEFGSRWRDCWGDDVEGIEALLGELPAAIEAYALSNINPLHLEDRRDSRPVLRYFKKIFASYEMGCAKPERAIYDRVVRELKVSASAIAFFDDRPENVEGARAAGLEAHVFENAGQIRRVLGLR